MSDSPEFHLVRKRFMEMHGACVRPAFGNYSQIERAGLTRAALGVRRAGGEPLFLERYLDAPVEQVVSAALGKPTVRESFIEIGRAHVLTPVTNAHLVCRIMLEHK